MGRLKVSLYVVAALALALPAHAAIYYGDFDWRDNGGNFVTPIRNQGSIGSCWAFSATAALESQFLIQNDAPGVNLNLSEQHLVCDSRVGMGGHENLALNYIVDVGITDEATLPYLAQKTSPLWPLDRPYTTYKITGVNNYCCGGSTTTNELKGWLETAGPLSCAINTGDFFDPGTIYGEEGAAPLDLSTPEWFEGLPSSEIIGPNDPVGGIDHSVLLIGYKDEASMPEGGYWIIKNSWGTGSGDSGFAFMKYGNVEKHNRIHALTGTTYWETVQPRGPVANDDYYTIDEDGKCVKYMFEGVRSNDTDINTPIEEVTTIKVTNTDHGEVELYSNGAFSYTPDENFYGTDTFRYRAFDGARYSDLATVTIDVISVNDVPVAVDDAYECTEGQATIKYKWEGVFANDYDADNDDWDTEVNDELTVQMQDGPSHGSVQWYSDGAFKYTPAAGFVGLDSLTYKVFDGTALSNLATVLFDVRAAESSPVPEPSALTLLLAALVAVAARRRR